MEILFLLALFVAAGANVTTLPWDTKENVTLREEETLIEESSKLKPVVDYLLLAFLILIMLSMGCEITKNELWLHIKRPVGISIGMFSQFIIMPVSAFTLTKVIPMSGLHATGVLIISCCPGGPLSNGFAYFCDGDLSLSVAMTSISTLLSMGVMPLNLWIYGRNLQTDDLVIPYEKLAISLVSVTSPVVVGMFIRWRVPRIASLVTKVGSYVSMVLVVICLVLEVIVFPNMFTGVPGRLFGVVLSLPLIGFLLGYSSAWALRQNMKVRKTVALECGLQNVPTALTIITLSFAVQYQEDLILLPWLYFFSMTGGGTCICIVYQIHRKWTSGKQQARKSMTMEMNGDALFPEAEVEKPMLESNGVLQQKVPV